MYTQFGYLKDLINTVNELECHNENQCLLTSESFSFNISLLECIILLIEIQSQSDKIRRKKGQKVKKTKQNWYLNDGEGRAFCCKWFEKLTLQDAPLQAHIITDG